MIRILFAVLSVALLVSLAPRAEATYPQGGGEVFSFRAEPVFAQQFVVERQFVRQPFVQQRFVQQRFVQPRFVQQRFVERQFAHGWQPIVVERFVAPRRGGFRLGLFGRYR
jgi:hypothetical protein